VISFIRPLFSSNSASGDSRDSFRISGSKQTEFFASSSERGRDRNPASNEFIFPFLRNLLQKVFSLKTTHTVRDNGYFGVAGSGICTFY